MPRHFRSLSSLPSRRLMVERKVLKGLSFTGLIFLLKFFFKQFSNNQVIITVIIIIIIIIIIQRLIAAVINSSFSFYWDIYYDWNVGQTNAKRYWFLRDQLVFRDPRLYYISIFLDLILRLSWSLRLSSHLHIDEAWGKFTLESLEIIRRAIWVFFRMENQHLRMAKVTI